MYFTLHTLAHTLAHTHTHARKFATSLSKNRSILNTRHLLELALLLSTVPSAIICSLIALIFALCLHKFTKRLAPNGPNNNRTDKRVYISKQRKSSSQDREKLRYAKKCATFALSAHDITAFVCAR